MPLLSWLPKSEHLVERTAVTLLLCFTKAPNGGYFGNDIWTINKCLTILISLILMHGVEDVGQKSNVIMNAAFKVVGDEEQSFQAFKEALETEIKSCIGKPLRLHRVIIALNVIEGEVRFPRSLVLGQEKVVFSGWKSLRRIVDMNEWEKDAKSNNYEKPWEPSNATTPIIIATNARNAQEAFSNAIVPFEGIQGMLNLEYCRGRFSVALAGPGRPHARLFLPSSIAVVEEGSKTPEILRPVDQCVAGHVQTLTKRQFAGIQWYKTYRRKAGQNFVASMVLDAIPAFTRAHETSEWGNAFLALWQILEFITLADHTDDIQKRASCLYPQNDVCEAALLIAARARNDTVHKGQFPSNGHDLVNLFSEVVDQCIDGLARLHSDLKTRDQLEDFYIFATKSSERRLAMECTLAACRKFR